MSEKPNFVRTGERSWNSLIFFGHSAVSSIKEHLRQHYGNNAVYYIQENVAFVSNDLRSSLEKIQRDGLMSYSEPTKYYFLTVAFLTDADNANFMLRISDDERLKNLCFGGNYG